MARLRAGDPPPADFAALAALSWEQWRTYAAACHLRRAALWDACRDAPHFALWQAHYSDCRPAKLPFDVGCGLEELSPGAASVPAPPPPPARAAERGPPRSGSAQGPAPAEAPHSNAREAAEPADGALWQAALAELSLQVTRATFDAWLRGSEMVGREGDQIVVAVHTPAARAWLENRLRAPILRTLRGISGEEELEVRFVVA